MSPTKLEHVQKSFSNLKLEKMLKSLNPLLNEKNAVGYAAAKNARTIGQALTEYQRLKEVLILKYGIPDDEESRTISIRPGQPNFTEFIKEFEPIGEIEETVDITLIPYEDIIGILSGYEILALDWMLTEVNDNG